MAHWLKNSADYIKWHKVTNNHCLRDGNVSLIWYSGNDTRFHYQVCSGIADDLSSEDEIIGD